MIMSCIMETNSGGLQRKTEIKAFLIFGAGKGRFALEDLPKGSVVRIQRIDSKELHVFDGVEDLDDIADSLLINYCHTLPAYSKSGINKTHGNRIFLNVPGMCINHGSGTSENIEYQYTATHKYTIAKRNIRTGEELLQDYRDYSKVAWFEDYMASLDDGRLSLRQLGLEIEAQNKIPAGSSSEEDEDEVDKEG